MDQFSHVMVLISVILGIGVAQILLGLGRVLDWHASSGKRLDLCIGHLTWLLHLLFWMVMFWWWQFRIAEDDRVWTLGLYLFLILYSVTLFLLAVVLVPVSGRPIESFRTFFLERRRWFYGLFLLATSLDMAEGLVKGGWDRVAQQGPWVWSLWALAIPVCVVGFRSRDVRHHNFMAVAYLLYQVALSFTDLSILGN